MLLLCVFLLIVSLVLTAGAGAVNCLENSRKRDLLCVE